MKESLMQTLLKIIRLIHQDTLMHDYLKIIYNISMYNCLKSFHLDSHMKNINVYTT